MDSPTPNDLVPPTIPPVRTRSRSSAVSLTSRPFEAPLTASDQNLARLVQSINRENEQEAKQSIVSPTTFPPPGLAQSDLFRRHQARLANEQGGSKSVKQEPLTSASLLTVNWVPSEAHLSLQRRVQERAAQELLREGSKSIEQEQLTSAPLPPVDNVPSEAQLSLQQRVEERAQELLRKKERSKAVELERLISALPPVDCTPSQAHLSLQQRVEKRAQELLLRKENATRATQANRNDGPQTIKREAGRAIVDTMSYQNYLDPSAGGSGSNPRQAPPSPSQNMNHANGVNGGAMGIGGMVGFPTPAGHQSDLNYIMGMVEELSRQLEHNQRLTSGVVEKIGKVRERAQNIDLNNDELIAMVAAELNEDTKNLEKDCSDLRKKLEKAEYNRDENWKLVIHGCNILSDILEKMHKYKEQHEMDTLAWHKNYRKQLADEREENLALRCQINDMRAAACRANEWLRKLRRAIEDNDEITELRIQNIALRQEKRFWKRMAMPLIPDDDSEWSDDDDLIDPEEKKRQAAEAAERERREGEGDAEGEGSAQTT